MDTQTPTADDEIVRATITITHGIDVAIRALAEKHDRPLSWEIRRALEAYIEDCEEAA